MPYLGELEASATLLTPGRTVLELGCGTGRLTRRLLEFGTRVTAIDDSAAMLETMPAEVETVLARIETLALDATFDVVVLASGLVNHPDRETREGFVGTARRHLAPGGIFLLQRQDPHWLMNAPVGSRNEVGPLSLCVEAVDRSVLPVRMTLRYELDTDVWRQSFAVVPLEEEAIERLLAGHGFGAIEWIEPRRVWLHARAT